MKRALLGLILLAAPAAALDIGPLRLDNSLYLMGTDSEIYPTRLENVAFARLKCCRLWVHDLFIWDSSWGRTSIEVAPGVLRPVHENALNNKFTIGYAVKPWFSVIAQRQDITGQDTVLRAGFHFKL
jgi:hypothetical protein